MPELNSKEAQRILEEFQRKLLEARVPDLTLSSTARLTFDIPTVSQMDSSLERQLLESAKLRFAPAKNVDIVVWQRNNTITLQFTKRF